MDLQEIWKATEASFEQLPEIKSLAQIQPHGLKNPLKKAKNMLGKNIIFSIIICLIYLPIIFIYRFWQIQLFIGITLLFTTWAGWTAFDLYRSIKPNVSADNLLNELKRVVSTLNQWIKVQIKVALFIYPISATGGYLLGGVIGSGKNVEDFMKKPIALYALIICILVLTPTCYYLSKWLFNKSFGKSIKQMNRIIAELTETENG